MSTWNRLDLEALGFQPIMPKYLPGRCGRIVVEYIKSSNHQIWGPTQDLEGFVVNCHFQHLCQ